MGVLGPASYLDRDSPGALLAGRIERAFQGCLILTFGGGVNEVQRDLIALFGDGLPRVTRCCPRAPAHDGLHTACQSALHPRADGDPTSVGEGKRVPQRYDLVGRTLSKNTQ